MGDHYHRIVLENVTKEESNSIADKIVEYLIKRKIISSQKADCVLSGEGYLPGENYFEAYNQSQDDLLNWSVNGVEVQIGHQVFYSNWLDEINCPNCGTNIHELEWGDALSEWCDESGNDKIDCPQCGKSNSIVDYIFEPTWAFGELGFTFWNWGDDFNKDFINDIQELTGKKVKTVYGRF